MRRSIPGVAIRTSFIVGFPGETQADFDELIAFVEAAQFDRVGVFRYSDDETSASYHLDVKVSARDSYNRQRRLMAVQRGISRKHNRSLVGQTHPILISGPSQETELLWEGRMPTQAEGIDGKTYLTDFGETPPNPGDVGLVRIERATDYDLFGTLESVTSPAAQALEPAAVALPVLQ